MMRIGLAVAVATLAVTGAAHGQEPLCDSTKTIMSSVTNSAWPEAVPSLMFDGQPVKCTRISDRLVSCNLAVLRVCANEEPTPEQHATFQTRLQKVFAQLPNAMQACLVGRGQAPHSKTTNFDGYLNQDRGIRFVKAGEPTVALVEGVSRQINGDMRCETTSTSVEFEIE